MVIYTSYKEYEPGVLLIASRLRFGADLWDMPERLFDFVTVNDHAPMLWTDTNSGIVYFFWGNPRLVGGFPFQWTSSKDSGATWAEVQFPNFMNELGGHSRQPINTAVRDKNGTLYVSGDGIEGSSGSLGDTRQLQDMVRYGRQDLRQAHEFCTFERWDVYTWNGRQEY